MQTDYILSIGLNVGDAEPENQLRDTLRAVVALGAVRDLAIGQGAWQGVPERFAQVRVSITGAYALRDLPAALSQDCIAFRRADDARGLWRLLNLPAALSQDGIVYRDATTSAGSTLAENPVILGRPNAADARDAMERDAEASATTGADTVGHSSIQAWSAGPCFPAVISTVERYAPGRSAADSTPAVSHRLTIAGWSEEYATHRDAESVARWACRDGRILADRFDALTKGRNHD